MLSLWPGRRLLSELADDLTAHHHGDRLRAMSWDVRESDHAMDFCVDLPGFKKEDLSVTVDKDNMLTIEGTRGDEKEESGDKWHRRERFVGHVKRSMRLPDNLNTDEPSASFDGGVLKLSFAKVDPVEPPLKKIAL